MKFPPQSAEKEPVPETIPSATTPKRHREVSPTPKEPTGDIKRMRVNPPIIFEHRSFASVPQQGIRIEVPEDIETDPPTQPVPDQHQSEEA